MSDNQRIEDKKERSEQQKANDFIKEFNVLCEKHQFQIITQPTFIARDDGTFSVKLISSVGKLPQIDNTLETK